MDKEKFEEIAWRIRKRAMDETGYWIPADDASMKAALSALTLSDLKALLAEREPGLCVVPREPSGKMLEGAYDAPLGRARGVVLDWVETEGMVDDDLPVLTSHVDKSFDHLMATAYKAMLAAAEGEG